ncbi:D-glycerate dehydrogenase [Rhodocaloribacter litoris]|uniref:2-hydroxyacid dehydrogenase n=1 Tax=Rhodocaloribacter litoris TaxID=2558931 RepID=UPI00141EF024|nr:D-glycerate dehydrogenase [Rhodocaloribacter litoris]QXD15033.1 D-glycerate dehydrogenase [Rhodocaloribacter litoris]GIV62173.1 MAG: D-glycerate dehydrogenase [Rhodothermaceae bacterium]
MARIVITRALPEAGIAALRRRHEVHVHDLGPHTGGDEDGLIAAAREAEALISMLDNPLTARVIEACPRLRVIAQYAVGYDNIDLEAARARGIVVTHTPGVLTDATADFTFALLLALARRLPEAERYVREGRFRRWETMLLLGMELRDKTLGIVGLGRIGAAVARRALAFGMRVVYHSRHRANPTVERMAAARYVSMDELLATSDVVSLHCPLNEQSRHLIDARALAKMKPTALLINTARGPVVDEAALVEALRAGRIAGAALDVYEREPEVHPGLLELDRVVLAPHLASATVETRTEMASMCARAVLAVLDGEEKIPYRLV